jgi:hypothetical protein
VSTLSPLIYPDAPLEDNVKFRAGFILEDDDLVLLDAQDHEFAQDHLCPGEEILPSSV